MTGVCQAWCSARAAPQRAWMHPARGGALRLRISVTDGAGRSSAESVRGVWSRISAGALLLRPCRCAWKATGGSERAWGAPQVARNPLVVAGRPLRVSRAHGAAPDRKARPVPAIPACTPCPQKQQRRRARRSHCAAAAPPGTRADSGRAGAQRAPAPAPAPAHGGEGAPGGDAYEHPKVREAHMAARALADRLGGRRLPGMDCGPPPERELVCYSDL